MGEGCMKPDFSIIPEPDRSVEIRKPLTKKQRAELALAQGGICGCGCGVKLDHAREGTIDEHVRALGLQGSNALYNRQIWRKPCSDEKTFKRDLPSIRTAQRIEKKSDPLTRKPSRMQSKPFPKPTTKIVWAKRPFDKRKP